MTQLFSPFVNLGVLASLSLTLLGTSQAAVIPAGVSLHPKQTLIRNTGSEPETLDPALAESVEPTTSRATCLRG